MQWRDESDLQSGCPSYEEKLKHVETEILTTISNRDSFYEVYDDEDSDNDYNMLDPTLLDLDMPVQDNVDSSIGPSLVTVEDISICREEIYTFCSQ